MTRTPIGTARPLLLLMALIAFASPAHAIFRSPQVAISGTTLQDLLDAEGQTVTVTSEQRLVQGFTWAYLTRPGTHFWVRALRNPDDALVVFEFSAPSVPYTIAPAGLADGWFTEVYFHESLPQIVVKLFDQDGALVSTTHHPGNAFGHYGLATAGPGGMFHPYDELNPNGTAHALVYWSTGAAIGGNWLCAETRTAADGGDFDFADAVFLLDHLSVTPVQRATWGTLKQRFR